MSEVTLYRGTDRGGTHQYEIMNNGSNSGHF